MTRKTGAYRDRLVAARIRIGLSQEEMAERLFTPLDEYLLWESEQPLGVAVAAAEVLIGLYRRLNITNIRALRARGWSVDDIARLLGTSGARISQIMKEFEARAMRHKTGRPKKIPVPRTHVQGYDKV